MGLPSGTTTHHCHQAAGIEIMPLTMYACTLFFASMTVCAHASAMQLRNPRWAWHPE